jgi:hypothetical protein
LGGIAQECAWSDIGVDRARPERVRLHLVREFLATFRIWLTCYAEWQYTRSYWNIPACSPPDRSSQLRSRLGTFNSILRAVAQHKGVHHDTIIAELAELSFPIFASRLCPSR